MYKTASAIAAYAGREQVQVEDVREAAQLALLHRQRRQPFQQPHLVTEQLDQMLEDFQNQSRPREPQDADSPAAEERGDDSDSSGLESPDTPPAENPDPESGPAAGPPDQEFETGQPYSVQSLLLPPPDRRERPAAGRRAVTVSSNAAGRYVRARIPQDGVTDLALDATLRAAAPPQIDRRQALTAESAADTPAVLIEPWDLREKVRETRTGSLIIFHCRRQRLHGRATADGGGQGRGFIPAARCLPAAGSGSPDQFPGNPSPVAAPAHQQR